VLFGLPDFLQMLDKCDNNKIFFTYDTTFNLGDFYLTTLVVQLFDFVDKPIIPVAFMLNERKFQMCHEQFCSQISKLLPTKVKSGNVNICTDGEVGCVNAISSTFPQWKHFHCWNHIIMDVEYWLKKHGAATEEMTVYKAQIRDLLNCRSRDDYDITLLSHRVTWSQAFLEYYTTVLEKKSAYFLHRKATECRHRR